MLHPTHPTWVLDDSPIDDPLGRGENAVGFFQNLRHPQSTLPDQNFGLPRFWERILRRIYGPLDEDGERLVREVFIMIGRGARKSTVAGALGLYHVSGRDVRRKNGQVLLASGSKAQAFHVFREARGIALETPGFVFHDKSAADILKVRGQGLQAAEDPYIMHIEDGTRLSVQSSDGDLSHGSTPSVVIYDELHVFKSRKLWSALQTGLPKVNETLQIVITTAGRGQTGLGWDEYSRARRIAIRQKEEPGYMPHYLPIIFEPPSPDADWQDRNLWELTNPGLSEGFPDAKGLAIRAESAKESPPDLDDFKQYNLNFWLSQSLSPFVEMGVYDEGADAVDVDAHEEFQDPCWIGVDLGWNDDQCAVVVVWPEREGGNVTYDVLPFFFVPEAMVEKRGDSESAKHKTWAEKGFLYSTKGNASDYVMIREKILELHSRFNVQEVAFDPKLASEMIAALLERGVPAVTMQQGWASMSGPIKELHRAVISRSFLHGGHPMLRWNFENIAVHTDSAGNQSFHKGKSKDKIDGAVATAMAVGRAHANTKPEVAPVPFYLQPGFDPAKALGLTDDRPQSEEETAAAAASKAEMEAKVRKMLGL